MWIEFGILIAGITLSVTASAVNKCVVGGQVTYQDAPCGAGAPGGSVNLSTPTGAVSEEERQRAIERAERDKQSVRELDKRDERAARERADAIARQDKRDSPDGVADRCFDLARPELFDAKGAYVVSFDYRDKQTNKKMKVEGRARTKGGGMTAYYVYCNVRDGSVAVGYSGQAPLDSVEWR